VAIAASGLHEPITLATRLFSRGMVEAVEMMVYRAPRGDEVRDPRLRKPLGELVLCLSVLASTVSLLSPRAGIGTTPRQAAVSR
jgi:hypothetical protein